MTHWQLSYNMNPGIYRARTKFAQPQSAKLLTGDFDLKARANMFTTNKLFCLLLAVMLAGGNMAFSAHASSHSASDSSLCSLCVHAGGADSAIVPEPGSIPFDSAGLTLAREQIPTRLPNTIFHSRQSRAPPCHI